MVILKSNRESTLPCFSPRSHGSFHGSFHNKNSSSPLSVDRFRSTFDEAARRSSAALPVLPLYDAHASTSSIGSSDCSPSLNNRRRKSVRRRSSTDDETLPLFNSNSDMNVSMTESTISRPPRSSSKTRGLRRHASGSAKSISALVDDAKARMHVWKLFDAMQLFQLLLLFVIALLVLHSHSKADFTVETLQRLRQQESLGLLQLQKIERQSLSLHESIRGRLQRAGVLEEHEADPLEPQHRQLEKMTSELDSQVTTLQKRIQLAARQEIIKAYGEGPVKVVIELDFDGTDSTSSRSDPVDVSSSSHISIALWPDTPHAAWTWLDQVGRHVWDGAGLEWDSSSTLLQFQPSQPDPVGKSRLEFTEHHPSDPKTNPDMHHGPWTVGLRESLSEDASGESNGRLEMFINLADNRETHKHETCIGKILDGFYALQRLLEATRMNEDGKAVTHVTVKSITAMHITNHELNQLY